MLPLPCPNAGTFTSLSFENATLVRSNLGGLGGRCDPTSFPHECADGALTSQTAHELYFDNVGKTADGRSIGLAVRNASEYRAWNPTINGRRNSQDGARAPRARRVLSWPTLRPPFVC